MQAKIHLLSSTSLLFVTTLMMIACNGHDKAVDTPTTDTAKTETPVKQPKPETPPPLSDLIITDIEIKPSPTIRADGKSFLIRGLTYTFRVKVKNAGQGAVQGAVGVEVDYGCPGYGHSGDLIYPDNNLQPGASSYSQPYKIKLSRNTGGRCSIDFKVDPYNVQKESDESEKSNVRRLKLEVP